MRNYLCTFLLISNIVFVALDKVYQQVPAKDNLKIYIRNDGMGGHSYFNFHAQNKSTDLKLSFTVQFSTDGQFPTKWRQSFTLKPNEDRIICARSYPGSMNLVYCDLVEAHYGNL